MPEPTGAPRARIAFPEIAIGLGVIAAAAAVAWQTTVIPVSPLYAKVGPTLFPALTALGLAGLGALLLLAGARGGWQEESESGVPLDKRAILFVAAGLLANVTLIGPLGFTAASTLMFTLVAYGFGSRRPLRDAGLGLVIALAAYYGFARALGVDIGAGLVERALNDLLAGG